jgi:predicted RND superfamily exporter protein
MLTLARAALARPLLVLALLAIGTAAIAKGLFRLELRTDGAAIYPQGDPAVERGAADRKTFHEADQVILLVTARPGGPLLASPAGFRYLQALQKTLARFPGAELAGVRSVVTLIDPPLTLQPLRIATYFEEWSGRDEDFAEVLARLRRLPVASGLFLSADGTAAAFYLPVGYRNNRLDLLDGLRRFLAGRPAGPFLLRLTGPVAAEVDLGDEVVRDLSRLVPIMVAVVAVLLALSLGTTGGVLIPLAQVVATLVWTLGLMGWCGIPVTLVTTVMPVLLMAMAMTDEIYLIERLQDHLATSDTAPGAPPGGALPARPLPPDRSCREVRHGLEGQDPREARELGGERVRRAAAAAFADLATPLVLISLATAAGFFSFLGAAITPLRHFGLFTGIGLLLGMLFTFTLAPALMAALPASWLERRRERRVRRGERRPAEVEGPREVAAGGLQRAAGGDASEGTRLQPARERWEAAARGDAREEAPLAPGGTGRLLPYERFTVRRGRLAALVAVGLLAAALPGLARLRVEDSWIDNFDPRSPLVTAARRFDSAFWGLYRFDVVLGGPPRFFWTPRGAAVLEEVQRWSAHAPHAGGAVSILPIFEAGARAIGFPLPLSALPAPDMNRVGLLVEVLRIRLYLRDILTLDGDHARARLFVRHADYSKARDLAAAFAAELPRIVASSAGSAAAAGADGAGDATAAAGPAVEAHASGEVVESLAVVSAVVGNQLRSIGWTAVLIAAILFAALRSLRWTAAVMAPVLGATLLLLAGLGYAGVPLGIATSMFAALNLGAGVDFAVQYVFAYRRERRAGLPHAGALAATLRTTGRGLRCNALVLSCGIAVLAFSAIKPSSSLGLLLALAMLVSYAATLALLPELLRWVISGQLDANHGP